MRILLVDDEDVIRQLMTEMLRDQGAAVVTARDGREAQTFLDGQDDFDAMVLYVSLPRMNGLRVLERLRAKGSRLPVVLIAGEARVSSDDCQRLAVGPVLLKPFKVAELMDAI